MNSLHPLRRVVGGLGAQIYQFLPKGVVSLPLFQPPLAQEVLVVELQLFQAGAGDACQLEFELLGGSAGLAALGDVLDAGAGGLDHLVVGAAALVDVAIAEADGYVVDELGHLEALEVPVAAVLGDQRFHHINPSTDTSLECAFLEVDPEDLEDPKGRLDRHEDRPLCPLCPPCSLLRAGLG